MATNDLNKLQEILNSAEDNHALLTRIRKQASKINSMMEEHRRQRISRLR